jgi:nitroreductase
MDESSKSPNPNFDCGLAVQNMYIAAVSLGYGAKVISSPTMTLNGENHDQICEELGIDPSLTAVAVLLIGKADEGVDGVSSASTRADFENKVTVIG